MKSLIRCQVCGRRTHQLRNWFDKMVCKRLLYGKTGNNAGHGFDRNDDGLGCAETD
jgi:hypothetical protein